MFFQGGSGSNEALTLADAAERLGIVDRARPDRSVLPILRRLERATGRRILVSTGEGRGMRHVVLGRELDAALEGEVKEADVSTLAERIASAVERIEQRVEGVSLGLAALTKRVALLEQRVR